MGSGRIVGSGERKPENLRKDELEEEEEETGRLSRDEKEVEA